MGGAFAFSAGSQWHNCRVQIQRATPDEWEASRDIRLRSLASDPTAFCSSLERARGYGESTWRARLDENVTVLAWNGEAAVGTATTKDDPHESGGREVVAMWVDPGHRRSGVARALIDDLVARARADRVGSVALWVADDNERAKRLYEGCGFAFTGEREPMRPGVDQVRMRLAL